MSRSGSGSGGYVQRPSRLSRVDLGAEEEDDLDYSYPSQPGPSNSSRHMASHSRPPPHHDPRSSRADRNRYHDDSNQPPYSPPRDRPRYPQPPHPPAEQKRTPSPEPDEAVLAYIRAQQQDTSTASDPHELRLSEQLKKDKFQHGASKVKSRVQREREAEERKKKQAEEDAAKAYDEFVAAMGGEVGDNDQKSGQQRKDGVESRRKVASFVGAGGKAYVGSRTELTSADTSMKEQERDLTEEKTSLKRVSNAFGNDSDGDDEDSVPKAVSISKDPPPRKRQAMTSFLSELQTTQAERESRLSSLAASTSTSISTLLAHETLSKPGSRDLVSDPLTTNICIPNLPPHTDERVLGDFFREWGDVATVKIMWPRGEQRDRVGGLTGFVAYMTRPEAERAYKEADGCMWGGTRVKLSWGKAMALPQRALYPMEKRRKTESSDDREMQAKRGGGSGPKSVVPKLVIRHRRDASNTSAPGEELRKKVEADYPPTQRLFIETVASRIRTNGAHFEHVLRDREADNPKFAFLFDQNSILYHYFRFCLDPLYAPSNPTLDEFSDNGSDELYSTDSGEESETSRLATSSSSSTTLGPLARRRFCSMLRSLTLRRDRIARITAFALDHAVSYTTIVSLLTSSLLQPSTPIPRKLARLYALSDILHNSGAPVSNAWRYRAALETQLPLIYAHLGQVAKSFGGRMKREEFRGKVLGVLEVWEGWIVVGPHVPERVKRLFEDPPVATQAKVETQDEDLDGEALDDAPANTVTDPIAPHHIAMQEEEEDLDGEAL